MYMHSDIDKLQKVQLQKVALLTTQATESSFTNHKCFISKFLDLIKYMISLRNYLSNSDRIFLLLEGM